MTQVHPLFQQILDSWKLDPTCDNCRGENPECKVCEGTGTEPEPTIETISEATRYRIERESQLRVDEVADLYTFYTDQGATKMAAEKGFSLEERLAGKTLAEYRRAVKQILAGLKGTREHGSIRYTDQEIDAIVEGEEIIYAAHEHGKPMPWPWGLAGEQVAKGRRMPRKPAATAAPRLNREVA